jgi:hypothetical protein
MGLMTRGQQVRVYTPITNGVINCSCCDSLFGFINRKHCCIGCKINHCNCCIFNIVIKEKHLYKLQLYKLPFPPSDQELRWMRSHIYATHMCSGPVYDITLCKKCHIIADDKSIHVKHCHNVMIHTQQ